MLDGDGDTLDGDGDMLAGDGCSDDLFISALK